MKLLKHMTVVTLILVSLTPFVRRSASTHHIADRVRTIVEREGDSLSADDREEVSRIVTSLAREYRLDPLLILAVMKVESRFDPEAVSNAKAYGLMQIRAIVVKAVAPELGILEADGKKMMTDPTFNIRIGVHYLSDLMTKFGGDLKKSLMAYNAGPTTVARLYKNRPAPDGGYQGRVLKAYSSFSNL